jgi:2-dehydropantoate 2-reductase
MVAEHLSLGDGDVRAELTRRREHAEALVRDGLRVSGRTERSARVAAAVDPAELPEPELVIVACKALDVDAAAALLAGHAPGAAVLTVQNGLGVEEIVRRHGEWPLLSGVTFMSGTKHSDTHVEYILDTATWLGPYGGTPFARAREAAELIAASGLKAEAFEDLRPAQWAKLIFNASVNTVAALTDLPHVGSFAAVESPTDLGRLVRDLMDEGKAVAAEVGVELHEDPWEMNVLAVRRGETESAAGAYAHVPSMLDDVRSGRRTEVDFITGALVREADRVGVPVPLHTAMLRLVKARETA